jgi:hypothetical protein
MAYYLGFTELSARAIQLSASIWICFHIVSGLNILKSPGLMTISGEVPGREPS